MSVARQVNHHKRSEAEFIKHAVGLLSQQVWCWGRDVLRAEGNWLLEVGFTRIEPPAHRKKCSSVYTLDLPQDRRVVLRGFGVFFGDSQRGGVFLPRFKFRPKFTTDARLECPPWSSEDLPKLSVPTESQRNCCVSLTLDLIDWIRTYESNIIELLGIEYRRSTLAEWDNVKQPIIPVEEMARAWQLLGVEISEDFQKLIPR
ncbi:hypothetical protein [Gimesia aquarii]|uniref:Uncharacterized protein n=1 Tax=Gimesia aquarii TaxID=2527964 RepID=A0A517W422_9PLAN|nr:hypothetical protein [Gimesia aquarii]QDU00008.1 hypothetical protein V144x_55210 [Gimesia aquarii]